MDIIKDTKQLYIFAGVNGSGKSTFYINQLLKNDFYGYRVNSDELAKELGNYESSYIQNKAGKLAIAMRNKFLNSGASFNIETTLSGKGIIRFIKLAKNKDYNITLFYIGLENVEISKKRVAIRVSKGGHNIDNKTLERRFGQSFDNLKELLGVCDKIYFYDNNSEILDDKEQTLSNAKLVAVKQNGEFFTIIDSYANEIIDKYRMQKEYENTNKYKIDLLRWFILYLNLNFYFIAFIFGFIYIVWSDLIYRFCQLINILLIFISLINILEFMLFWALFISTLLSTWVLWWLVFGHRISL